MSVSLLVLQPRLPCWLRFKIRFYFCLNCGSNLLLRERPEPGRVRCRRRRSVDANLPPPGSSIFENGMFQWLALPTVTDHFPEGRPPVAG